MERQIQFKQFRQKITHRNWLKFDFIFQPKAIKLAMFMICLLLFLTMGKSSIVLAQYNSVSLGQKMLNIFESTPSINRVGNLIGASVKLDGRQLFDVATTGSENTFPIHKRVDLIENELQGIVSNRLYEGGLFSPGFQKETLTITVSGRNGETIIIAYDGDRLQKRQILTVTEEDAKYNGYSILDWAEKLTILIKEALIKAQAERQPTALLRQIGLATVLLFILLISSGSLMKAQKRLRKQRLAIKDYQEQLANGVSIDCALIKCPIAKAQSELLETREKNQSYVRVLNFIKLKRRLFELGQLILFGGTITLIISLFPWTRWLRFTVLEKLLLLFIILFGTIFIIRCGVVLVDRYYQTLLEEESLNPQSSKRLSSRLLTYSEVVKDSIFWGCSVISFLVTLTLLGINVTAFLTGAGLFGIAVTLVAQNLVKDIISGLQILRQDSYAVGDYLLFEDNLGLVEKITLSMTQIRGPSGRLITIPNGEIRVVHNLTKEWARVDFSIKVSPDTDSHLVMQLMQEIGQQMSQESEWQSAIIDPAVLIGINNLDYTGVEIQFWMKVTAKEQWSVAREFRIRLKHVFDERGIKIGIPQQFLQLSNASLQEFTYYLNSKETR